MYTGRERHTERQKEGEGEREKNPTHWFPPECPKWHQRKTGTQLLESSLPHSTVLVGKKLELGNRTDILAGTPAQGANASPAAHTDTDTELCSSI